MALMSDPILVANATPWSFAFSNYRSSVAVQVRFYTDAAATEANQLSPRGTGARDLVATNLASAYAGTQSNPTAIQRVESDIDSGTLTGAVDGKWYELTLDGGLGQITITSTPNVTPGSAVSYRIIVEADGQSSAA